MSDASRPDFEALAWKILGKDYETYSFIDTVEALKRLYDSRLWEQWARDAGWLSPNEKTEYWWNAWRAAQPQKPSMERYIKELETELAAARNQIDELRQLRDRLLEELKPWIKAAKQSGMIRPKKDDMSHYRRRPTTEKPEIGKYILFELKKESSHNGFYSGRVFCSKVRQGHIEGEIEVGFPGYATGMFEIEWWAYAYLPKEEGN